MLKGLTRFLGPCLFLALLAVPMSVQAPAGAGQEGGSRPPLAHVAGPVAAQAGAVPGSPAGAVGGPGAAIDPGTTAAPAPPASPGAAPVAQHVVQKGETLWSIARQHGLDVEQLAAINELADPDRLRVGQRLLLVPSSEEVHRVQPGDTVYGLARRYGVDADDIVSRNGLSRPDVLSVGQLLVIPGAAGPGARGAAGAQGARAAVPAVGLEWPVRGRITSYFGPRWGRTHTGVDIAASYGTPIRAAQAGVVRSACWLGGYGRAVVIDHANGVTTLYGHASRLVVHAGQRVAKGEVVATVGSSGNSTGPHLHFELRVGGKARNPLSYLRPGG